MKKTNKWFGLKIALGAIATLTPLAALTACSTTKEDNSINKAEIALASKVLNVKDGTLQGFKTTASKEQISEYLKEGKLVIPNGLGINKIGAHAFSSNVQDPVTEVVIKANVTEIGKFAYYGLKSLTTVTFEDGISSSTLQHICEGAFAGCEKLTRFSFPKNVAKIDLHAFAGCKALGELDFSNMTLDKILALELGDNVFDAGSTTGKIVLPAATQKTDENNIKAGVIRSNLFAAGLEVSKPTVEEITSNTYSWKISLGNTVWAEQKYFPIPRKYLTYENAAKSILLGINAKYASAINKCNTLYIDSNTENFAVDEHGDITFDLLNEFSRRSQRTNIKYLWIDDNGITSVPHEMCTNNNSETFKTPIEGVRLPVTSNITIGEKAFAGCDKLTTVNINDATKLTTIGKDAFNLDTSLTKFSIIKTDGSQNILSPTEKLTVIQDHAFQGCTSIAGIKLWNPANIANFSIGEQTFKDCTGVKTLDISGLTYEWVPSEEEHATGTFVSAWMNIGGKNIFEGFHEPTDTEKANYKVLLPKSVPLDDFAGLAPGETVKTEWVNHENSGFYWMNSHQSDTLFNWTYTEDSVLKGGSRSITLNDAKAAGTDGDKVWLIDIGGGQSVLATGLAMVDGSTVPSWLKLTDGNVNWTATTDAKTPGSYKFYVTAELTNGRTVKSPLIEIIVPTPAITFNNDSWENVVTWSNKGLEELKNHYGLDTFVGQTRTVTVNTQKHTVRVIGENHDVLTNKSDKATLTFEFVNPICDRDGYGLATLWNDTNSANINVDYLNSTLRYNLTKKGTPATSSYKYWFVKNGFVEDDGTTNDGTKHSTTYSGKSVLDMIAAGEPALANGLQSVKKEVGIYNSASNTWSKATYDDKLFLPTVTEITKETTTHHHMDEGSIYKYYEDHDDASSRIKKHINTTTYIDRSDIAGGETLYPSSFSNQLNYAGSTTAASQGASRYWLNSPCTDNNIAAFGANCSGVIGAFQSTSTVQAMSVAPCFCIGAVPSTHTIAKNVTNGTASGATTITEGQTATVTITPNTGYHLPDTVTVTGAQHTYAKDTGVITLSNPTSDVTITATCPSDAPVATDFATDPWSTINYYANLGSTALCNAYGKESINDFVGLTRKVTINGLEHQVRVVDVCHDEIANADKVATLTFQFDNYICDANGNSMATYIFDKITKPDVPFTDYANSTIQATLNGSTTNSDIVWYTQGATSRIAAGSDNKSVIEMMSSSIPANYIQTVAKENWYSDTSTDTFPAKLFLPSATELGFNDSTTKTEGTVYKWIKDERDAGRGAAAIIKTQLVNASDSSSTPLSEETEGGKYNYAGTRSSTTLKSAMYSWIRSLNVQQSPEPAGANCSYNMIWNRGSSSPVAKNSWKGSMAALPIAPCFCMGQSEKQHTYTLVPSPDATYTLNYTYVKSSGFVGLYTWEAAPQAIVFRIERDGTSFSPQSATWTFVKPSEEPEPLKDRVVNYNDGIVKIEGCNSGYGNPDQLNNQKIDYTIQVSFVDSEGNPQNLEMPFYIQTHKTN